MSDADHRKLATLLNDCKAAVVLSGYDSPLYSKLYQGWNKATKEIANHAAGGRAKAREKECIWIKPPKRSRTKLPGDSIEVLPFRLVAT
jgi:DNA adenine methylase